MKKVITINLNGRAYQLDDDAYQTLSAYLEESRASLKDNPDLAEIMLDLEQAIADKCQRFLGPHKSVVQAHEIAQVLEEMGPVDGSAKDPSSAADGGPTPPRSSTRTPGDQPAPKRLYLLQDGEEWIGGVCNGLAAYFRIDPAIVRIIFVIVAVSTSGIASAVYAVLWFTLPIATTQEEVAAAHGAPFNAKEIVDQANLAAKEVNRATREATEVALKGSREFYKDWTKKHREFTRHWRKGQREWRRQRRAWKQEWRRSGWGAASSSRTASAGPAGYGAQVTAGIMVPVLTLVSAAFFWVWAATMMSFLVTGAVFGRSLPGDLPQWAAFLILILGFSMISWQIQQARHASHNALGGRYYYGGVAAWDSMMWVGFWLLCGWAAWEYVPEVRQFFNDLPTVADRLREIFRFRTEPS